jgi:hypothetical protein
VIDREREEDRDNTRGKVMEMLLLLWNSFSEKNEGCGMRKIFEKNCQGSGRDG